MKKHLDIDHIGKTTAITTQVIGSVVYGFVVVGWAWSISGTVWGTLLLALLVALITAPVLTCVLPVVSLLSGSVASGAAWVVNALRGHHSRA